MDQDEYVVIPNISQLETMQATIKTQQSQLSATEAELEVQRAKVRELTLAHSESKTKAAELRVFAQEQEERLALSREEQGALREKAAKLRVFVLDGHVGPILL